MILATDMKQHDRIMSEDESSLLYGTGIGRSLAQASLWFRMLRGRPNLEVDEYQECLETLASIHGSSGSRVIFLWPITGVDFEDHELYGEEDPSPKGLRLIDYRAAMAAAAQSSGATFVDGPKLAKQSSLTRRTALLDEVHPSAAGHRVLARGLADEILSKD